MTEERPIIFINRDEGYIEIMGNKIYWDRGWEEFLDYLKNQKLTIEKQSKKIESLKELRNKIEKEYNCAMEGFMKKQIPISVVDGTIAQETGWILNEIDKILNDGGENK